jgi:hypothetical protein
MNQTHPTAATQSPAQSQAITRIESAECLWAFIYFFIVSAEWKLLGGEFGHEKCHETLSSEQTDALRQALHTAAEMLHTFDAEVESSWHLGAQLSKLTDELASNPSLHPNAAGALRGGLDSAIRELARLADPTLQLDRASSGHSGAGRHIGRTDALKTFKACAGFFFTGLTVVIDAMTEPDGTLGRAAVEEVFVCTDTGLGIVTALKSYLLDHSLSGLEFLSALEDQVKRSTVQEAAPFTTWFLAYVARAALYALR